MNLFLGQAILSCLVLYLVFGLVFGTAFALVGVGRVDAAARGTSIGFRLLIWPGSMVFWPFLAIKWIKVLRRGVYP